VLCFCINFSHITCIIYLYLPFVKLTLKLEWINWTCKKLNLTQNFLPCMFRTLYIHQIHTRARVCMCPCSCKQYKSRLYYFFNPKIRVLREEILTFDNSKRTTNFTDALTGCSGSLQVVMGVALRNGRKWFIKVHWISIVAHVPKLSFSGRRVCFQPALPFTSFFFFICNSISQFMVSKINVYVSSSGEIIISIHSYT